jgi:hypothetical protein
MKTKMQMEYVKDTDKAIKLMMEWMNCRGIEDEWVVHELRKVSDLADMYADDIEKKAMHLNEGFKDWEYNG